MFINNVSKQVGTLTSIRFFAAIWVLIAHCPSSFFNQIFPTQFFQAGSAKGAGVSLFFVLSGFILSYTYQERFKEDNFYLNYKKFILNRFARIYPLHIACLYYVTKPLDILNVEFWTNVFLVQGWGFIGYTGFTYNSVAWSVSVELFCYLFLPFLLLLLKRINQIQLVFIYALFSFIVFRGGWMKIQAFLSPYLPSLTMGPPGCFFHAHEIFYEGQFFIVGALLYPLVKNLPQSKWWDLGCGFAFVGWFVWFHRIPVPNFFLSSVHFIYALLIVSLYRTTGLFQKIFSNSVLVYLGEISFSIYMLHYLAYNEINMLLKYALGVGYSDYLFSSIYPLLIIPFAAISYNFLELPARNFLRTVFASGQKLKPQFS